ncbi:hypothetical protein [uncultured Anaerococcus sp.]|uniref:hypothetical protein n=1 Tax=uncultured Anaerococcus sp. TaxID=293428 RepID=UPI00261084BA|nr:hypothetical protein [uncultured Anaerococcus sp.]
MKFKKYTFLILVLNLVLSSKISYANEMDPRQNNNNIRLEEENPNENFYEDSADVKKEELTNYIETIKTSEDYLSASPDNKVLYDNAIEFNSRALETDNEKWIAFSYYNLEKDIETIKEIQDPNSPILANVNKDSSFYKNTEYKIAYLRLSKEEQDTLDNLKESMGNQKYLTIANLESSHKYSTPIFFSDWFYPFMKDADKDGTVGETEAERNAFAKDKDLYETYRNTKPEDRSNLREKLGKNENNKESQSPTNPPSITIVDTPSDEDKLNSDSKEKDDTKTTDDSSSKEKERYSSIFYMRSKTRKAYIELTDEQKAELDNMNTDGNEYLSIEDLEKSGRYKLPIIKDKDWLYPFMLDTNEDGFIDEDDRNKSSLNEKDKNNNRQKEGTKAEATDKNPTNTYNSVFYDNQKTRQAYINLTDEQRGLLDKINTDNKYPLTIEELLASNLFKLPIRESDWIYPFMVDENNNGIIGEDYNSNEVKENNQNTSQVAPSKVSTFKTNIKEDLPRSNPSEKIVANKNVKTGVSRLNLPIALIAISSCVLVFIKRYK